MPQLSLHGPFGSLTVSEEDEGLVALDWGWGGDQQQTDLLRRAREQLHAYFDRELREFDLPLAPQGSAFQRAAWRAFGSVAFGSTCTCLELGSRCGIDPRALGRARSLNPLPILIPSHRLVGPRRPGAFIPEGTADTARFLIDLERNP